MTKIQVILEFDTASGELKVGGPTNNAGLALAIVERALPIVVQAVLMESKGESKILVPDLMIDPRKNM